MTILVALLAIGLAALGFALGLVLGRRRARRSAESELARREPRVERVAFDPIVPIEAGALRSAADCPGEWREHMARVGDRLRAAGVRAVVFVHGTFAGDDPLSAARLLGRALGSRLERALRAASKAVIDASVGDMANFSPEYVRLFEQGLGGGLPCLRFAWSSENHHAARVVGAIRLLRFVAATTARSNGDRILLVGHSHAGQLFAVATHLLAGNDDASAFVEAARECGEPTADLAAALSKLRGVHLDVATFGTPHRYAWAGVANVRAVHVVNHRGPLRRAGLSGLLTTRDGDYVAMMGGPGSDLPAVDPTHRRVNARLDGVLDRGSSVRTWLAAVRRAPLSPAHGDTLLVDYRDAGERSPNWLRTWFGHAAYTRLDAMLFNAWLVAENLYPLKGPRTREDPCRLPSSRACP